MRNMRAGLLARGLDSSLNVLVSETRRLRASGVQPTHTWSSVLVPLIWACSSTAGRARLLAALRVIGTGEAAVHRVSRWWRSEGVSSPEEAAVWMMRCLRDTLGVAQATSRPLLPYAYFGAPLQEHIMQLAEASNAVQEDLILVRNDPRSSLPSSVHPDTHAERDLQLFCAICQESSAARTVSWPSGCGHMFHEHCLATWLQSRIQHAAHPDLTCPICRAIAPLEAVVHIIAPAEACIGERHPTPSGLEVEDSVGASFSPRLDGESDPPPPSALADGPGA